MYECKDPSTSTSWKKKWWGVLERRTTNTFRLILKNIRLIKRSHHFVDLEIPRMNDNKSSFNMREAIWNELQR